MGQSSLGRLFDFRRLFASALGVLFVAPIGFGVPYLLGSQTNYGYGVILMLLLLGPSTLAASRLAGAFRADAAAPSRHLIAGCLAPLLGVFLWSLGFVVLDELCEADVFGCSVTHIWALAALVWAGTVFAWVAGASVLEDYGASRLL